MGSSSTVLELNDGTNHSLGSHSGARFLRPVIAPPNCAQCTREVWALPRGAARASGRQTEGGDVWSHRTILLPGTSLFKALFSAIDF